MAASRGVSCIPASAGDTREYPESGNGRCFVGLIMNTLDLFQEFNWRDSSRSFEICKRNMLTSFSTSNAQGFLSETDDFQYPPLPSNPMTKRELKKWKRSRRAKASQRERWEKKEQKRKSIYTTFNRELY